VRSRVLESTLPGTTTTHFDCSSAAHTHTTAAAVADVDATVCTKHLL
jgi:hypothetical protein